MSDPRFTNTKMIRFLKVLPAQKILWKSILWLRFLTLNLGREQEGTRCFLVISTVWLARGGQSKWLLDDSNAFLVRYSSDYESFFFNLGFRNQKWSFLLMPTKEMQFSTHANKKCSSLLMSAKEMKFSTHANKRNAVLYSWQQKKWSYW